MNILAIPPLAIAAGFIHLPGSKSISNRVLLLAALSAGVTEIHDLLDSDDTRVMLAALVGLGVRIESTAGQPLVVHGVGGVFPVKTGDFHLGNAGTAFRPLTAALALSGGKYRLSGVPRMHERPISDLVDGLRQLGADVEYEGNPGFPPLRVGTGQIKLNGPIRLRGDVSSQFLTALLMALPLTGQAVTIEMTTPLISQPYVAITLKLLERFGVGVKREGWQRFTIPADVKYRSPGSIYVEGDASSASYFLAAGALAQGPVEVRGIGRHSIQGDLAFAEALSGLGACVSMSENSVTASSPSQGGLQAFDLDVNHIPDAAMTLAIVALFTGGTCRLRNIASWRVKETDRIEAMATELRKFGATVATDADSITITPPPSLRPDAQIATYDDHRMAMCFSLVALAGVPVRIEDPACVAKTYPDYFSDYAQLTAPVIAIDGPSASGKGTVAQRVAAALGYHFLDSGALYRLTALAASRADVDFDNPADLARVAANLDVSFVGDTILLAGDDVTEAIRAEAVGNGASKIAAVPAVREALLQRQRAFRRFPGLVADGRDMASVVFPDAAVKIFLSASATARAERRYKQLMAKGMPANMPTLLQDLQERDARDAQRAVAPLQQSTDSRLVDTTALTIEEAVANVLEIVRAGIPSGKQ